jgi:predicted component of type VI protein secretion system
VPRLHVFRGDALLREVEIERLPLTIGRGATNDLVLDDPLKSVSREHAEIRLQDGTYVIADRNSENGVWAAGKRMPIIAFAPDTIASIGPFRLKIEGLPAPAPAATATPAPAAKASAVRPPVTTTPMRVTRPQMLGAAAVLVVGVAVAGGMALRSSQERQRLANELAATIAAATTQIEQGTCADALTTHIQPALARRPDDTALLDLKARAEACVAEAAAPTPEPPPPPPSEVDVAVAALRSQFEQGQCDAAMLQQVMTLLQGEPLHEGALGLKASLDGCIVKTPVKPPPPKPALAVRIAPEDGGLEPLPGELDTDYQERVRTIRRRYDEAVAIAVKGQSQRAIEAFEGIAKDATPRYLDVGQRLAAARRSLVDVARQRVDEARELAQQNKWNEALAKLREAGDLDPSLQIDAEMQKIAAAKLEAGRRACTEARRRASYPNRRNEAMDFYRQVLELLPPADECYSEAMRIVSPK